MNNNSIDESIEVADSTDEKITEVINNNSKESIYIEMINSQITQVNMFSTVRNMYAENIGKISCLMEDRGEHEIYDDPWLRLNELQNINVLMDESFDSIWRLIYSRDREYEKIKNGECSDIDKFVVEYTDIINDKIEFLNKIGEMLDNLMIEIQSKTDMVKDVKQKENIDDEALKWIYDTLDKILKKQISVVLNVFESIELDAEPAIKMDTKKDTKKNTK